MVESYLTGLTWNLQYYLGNSVTDPNQLERTCPDWQWKYNYLVAPPVSDIYKYLQAQNRNTNAIDVLDRDKIEYRRPVTTDVQLLLILPPQSNHLLKMELQGLMTSPDSPISYQYPTDFKIDLLGHRFRWECYPILPPIDLKATETAVSVILDPTLKQLPIRLATFIKQGESPVSPVTLVSPVETKKLVFKKKPTPTPIQEEENNPIESPKEDQPKPKKISMKIKTKTK